MEVLHDIQSGFIISIAKKYNFKNEIFRIQSKQFSSFVKLPKGFYQKEVNRRAFFDKMAKSLSIRRPRDWGNITREKIIELGALGILVQYYQNSLFKALCSLYPDISWKAEWFNRVPRNYWQDLKNQRSLLIDIGKKLHVKNHKDWGRVRARFVKKYGGASLLGIYGDSMLKALKGAFPDISWKDEWFESIPKYSHSYWNSISNQRKFLAEIEAKYSLENPNDWRKITTGLIHKNGGMGLMMKYSNSLLNVLNSIYGEKNWGLLINISLQQGNVVSRVKSLLK